MDEFKTFVYNNDKQGHEKNSNDDLIFALGIALFIRDTEFENVAFNIDQTRAMLNAFSRVVVQTKNVNVESNFNNARPVQNIQKNSQNGYQNSNDEQAFTILTKFSEFYQKQLQLSKGNSDTVYAVYSINGKPLVDFEDVSTNVSMLSAFHVSGDDSLNRLEASKIVGQYNKIGYWGEANNVRNQQAVWRYYDQFYTRLD